MTDAERTILIKLRAETYFSKQALSRSVVDFFPRTLGSYFRKLDWFWRRLYCFFTGGHLIRRQAWVEIKTAQVAEYHCGCIKCPKFWTEPASTLEMFFKELGAYEKPST